MSCFTNFGVGFSLQHQKNNQKIKLRFHAFTLFIWSHNWDCCYCWKQLTNGKAGPLPACQLKVDQWALEQLFWLQSCGAKVHKYLDVHSTKQLTEVPTFCNIGGGGGIYRITTTIWQTDCDALRKRHELLPSMSLPAQGFLCSRPKLTSSQSQ